MTDDALPTIQEMIDIPALAILSLLESAAALTQRQLLAMYPDLEIRRREPRGDPGLTSVYSSTHTLLNDVETLQTTLARYRIALILEQSANEF